MSRHIPGLSKQLHIYLLGPHAPARERLISGSTLE
jgi:hypothetical protein